MSQLTLLVAFVFVGVAFGGVIPEENWAGRIVGGSTASLGQFPWQCSLRTASNAHFCGCSIISARWVVSAAHCTPSSQTPANTRVVVGTISRTTGGTTLGVSRIINHPSYNANTVANDVCVIQTAANIVTSSNVRTIGLGSATVGGGAASQVSGWGQTAHPGSAAANLQWLPKVTLTNADCRAAHTVNNRPLIFDSTICARGTNPTNTGVCMGDSGGPLVSGNLLIGIVSWVIPCGRGFPDSYARVSSYRTWILQNAV